MSTGVDCSNALRPQIDNTIHGFERKRGQSDGDDAADGEAKRPRVGVTDNEDAEEEEPVVLVAIGPPDQPAVVGIQEGQIAWSRPSR